MSVFDWDGGTRQKRLSLVYVSLFCPNYGGGGPPIGFVWVDGVHVDGFPSIPSCCGHYMGATCCPVVLVHNTAMVITLRNHCRKLSQFSVMTVLMG